MYTKAFEKLMAALSRSALVLTANARLTKHLVAEYDLAMRRSGVLAWPTPEVMPFYSWVSSLWEEHGRLPALTGVRALALWERIIEAGQASKSWPASGVAKASFDALRLMYEYGIALPKEDIYLTEEAKALKGWQAGYEGELRRLGFIGEAAIPAEATKLIDRGVPVANEVILAGFDELSPAIVAITGALRRRSVNVSCWPAPEDCPPAGRVETVACKDEEEEIIRAARWARSVYEPGKRIGVIVPGLERCRKEIIREFTAELDPASVLPGDGSRAVFNISLGVPLSDEPLVASALDILSIGGGKEKTGLLRRALSSRFMALDCAESFSRLDVRLREGNRLEAGLLELKAFLKGGASKRLGEWVDCLKEQRKKQLPGAWARAFTDLLDRIGWSKGLTLASGEYQSLAAWNRAMESLASLDDVLGNISRTEALSRLSSIARETIHQVETPDAGIQVLGVLEATGLWFDHVRVLGCHQFALPSEPSPNPFIPLNLQRAAGLPHATSERELEFARAVAGRLISCAPSVLVSWPLVSEDRELKVSSLFSGFPVLDEGPLPSARLMDMPLAALEELPLEGPLPVSEAEKATLRGGTSILKNQSICPFRAFAIHRLNARPLPQTELDLKPETRGSIVHAAMRLFWEDVRDSRRLQELKDSGGLRGYVENIAAKALHEADIPAPLSKRFMELEHQRLAALLMDWAEVELKRETGFRVKTVELEKELVIGGLSIKGRVDRIDETESGGEIILDYKTGSPDLKDWLSTRPMDPQLLVYCIGSKFDAVSFARIRPGECKFVGICVDDSLPGIKPYESDRFRDKTGGLDWKGLMAFWKEAVEGLAADFLAGKNGVDPNNGPNDNRACEYCELVLLCRHTGGPNEENEGDEHAG